MQEGILFTATQPDKDVVAAMEQKFAEALGEPVKLEVKIEAGLLGGPRVMIGGSVFDGSLKAQLSRLRAVLMDRPTRDEDQGTLEGIGALLRARLRGYESTPEVRGAGRVIQAGDGVARLSGLTGCRLGELIEFPGPAYGMALNLEENEVGAVLLSGEEHVSAGCEGYGTGQVLMVPVGDGMLGRVVNPLGQPVDGGDALVSSHYLPLEAPAPAIIDRQPVNRPMETGLVAVDAMVPIGRGQRELILGDRQTGKTTLAIDTIINQHDKNVLCIYVAIGQKASTVAGIVETLRASGALAYSVVVCATASDSATMQYIAPYCGCAIAEHFMMSGRDTLIVYDDLTKHAVAYRAMSLLLRRPPGREAYPGDVFYLHSRLLERSAHVSAELGGGSMTALPIVETLSGDISSYITTNVISITDGQVFLDVDLFRAGIRPAVNVGLSVSRVAGNAQTRAMRKVSGQLRLELAQYRELQIFSQFSSDLDKATQQMLRYGEMLTELLRQGSHSPLSSPHQVALLYAATRGLLPQSMPLSAVRTFKEQFPAFMTQNHPRALEMLQMTGLLDDSTERMLSDAVKDYLRLQGIVRASDEEAAQP